MKRSLLAVGIIGLLLVSFCIPGTVYAEKKVKWRCQTHWPTASTSWPGFKLFQNIPGQEKYLSQGEIN